jgi:hypothetical protein
MLSPFAVARVSSCVPIEAERKPDSSWTTSNNSTSTKTFNTNTISSIDSRTRAISSFHRRSIRRNSDASFSGASASNWKCKCKRSLPLSLAFLRNGNCCKRAKRPCSNRSQNWRRRFCCPVSSAHDTFPPNGYTNTHKNVFSKKKHDSSSSCSGVTMIWPVFRIRLRSFF